MISKEIVEAMNGDITITSMHGKGTSFFFNMVVGVVKNTDELEFSNPNDSMTIHAQRLIEN